MITSPYDKYRQSSVQTSSPAQLLLMMFDGAIRFGKAALEGIDSADFNKVSTNLGKAQTIVNELITTLDNSYEVSKGLASMYEYINHLFIESNIKKSKEQAEEAIGYLMDLRQTFAQASKMTAGQDLQHG
ncbi:flagellar export chaperone FliS [Paenibacillus sp. MMS20-IR301]|uniref:flagellar export chaperone FliS n=1 Tax=Paenibacillus sp. MMS20-IR301 TaxID=2895946 RepID=UPI0028F15267|nr:flagellar export chaperone FliS [Paenibacillus sp. MMS20-IR301]WNS42670.1 flagellar export chaperone FliS [Paenibacillus sp. MMS20-IR301]